ncbi:MAG: histidine kinase dimerization/phospho-acceptor domain-containing protein, partial [Candidatus Acidiferrales bacterium]
MKPSFPTAILDSLSSGVLALDLENRILFLNRAWSHRLGIEREHWLGRPAMELASIVEPRIAYTEGFRAHLNWLPSAETNDSREIEWKDSRQSLYFREDSGPLRDASGQIVGRLFAYHDISREKAIDRMKSEFISVASHELRTPMTSIKGSVDLILSGFAGEISPDTQELLQIAQSACDRLIRLINDILDLSKIETGQVKLKLVRTDLTGPVEDCLRSLKSLADQVGVTLTLDYPPDLPLVEVDEDRIHQVITNLVFNAIKFSPAKSDVRIGLSCVDGWVQCSVSDQGCG